MEKFTLEAAQLGKPLITRDGRPARYVAIMKKSNEQFPVVAEVFQYTEEEIKEKFEEGEGKPTAGPYTTFEKRIFEKFEKLIRADNGNWHMENYSINGEYLPPFENELDLFINTL